MQISLKPNCDICKHKNCVAIIRTLSPSFLRWIPDSIDKITVLVYIVISLNRRCIPESRRNNARSHHRDWCRRPHERSHQRERLERTMRPGQGCQWWLPELLVRCRHPVRCGRPDPFEERLVNQAPRRPQQAEALRRRRGAFAILNIWRYVASSSLIKS